MYDVKKKTMVVGCPKNENVKEEGRTEGYDRYKSGVDFFHDFFQIPTNPTRMRVWDLTCVFHTGQIPTNPTRMRLGFK